MHPTSRFLLAVGVWLFASSWGFGQQTLQWNLQAGDRFRIVTSQDVALAADVDKRSVGMSHHTVVQLAWQVAGVDEEEGAAQISQSVERVKVRLKSPGTNELTYDTASQDKPEGPAAQLAAAVAPLLSTGATFHVHADGHVSDVRLQRDADALDDDKSPAAEAFARFLTREGAIELSGIAYLGFPSQPVSQGDRWNLTSDVQTAAGPFQRMTTYEFVGQDNRGDRQLAKVALTWKLAPRDDPEPPLPGEPARMPKARIARQDNHGEILFDGANGYPVEAVVRQRLTFVSPSGEQEVRQQVASEMKIRITKLPPDDGAGER